MISSLVFLRWVSIILFRPEGGTLTKGSKLEWSIYWEVVFWRMAIFDLFECRGFKKNSTWCKIWLPGRLEWLLVDPFARPFPPPSWPSRTSKPVLYFLSKKSSIISWPGAGKRDGLGLAAQNVPLEARDDERWGGTRGVQDGGKTRLLHGMEIGHSRRINTSRGEHRKNLGSKKSSSLDG